MSFTTILELIGALCGLVSKAFSIAPLLIVLAFLFAPSPPHMRWEYSYIPMGSKKHFIRCTYLGPKGFVTPDFPPNCPFFALINPDDWSY